MKNVKSAFHYIALLAVMLVTGALSAHADIVKGNVVDETGEPLIGATVMVVGIPGGTATDFDGNYSINVPDIKKNELRFSYVGMDQQVVKVNSRKEINVVLKSSANSLDEVVVVGYGQQKKASVVGAIAQTSGATLAKAGGVSSVGAALTGNLPGVTTMASSGMPGEEDPQIVIRGQTSWNGSDPLILVDGIERPMNSVDINSVESISVLKDASATAVYGVKGANGVILITTKRGQEGRAEIGVAVNAAMKVVSKLPGTEGSPEALYMRNRIIERELGLQPDSWGDMTPMDIIEKYRNPANLEEYERYPNVDWQKELFKDYAMAYNPNINVRGGTKFVKYYAALDYLHEGDLYREYNIGRGYKGGFGYNRVNIRSNLDFKITPTTNLKVNLSGSHGEKKAPWGLGGNDWATTQLWSAAYSAPADAFRPLYSDGTWGYYPSNEQGAPNSMQGVATGGIGYTTTTRINTDFTLEQDLKFITPGLRASAMVSWDNNMQEHNRGIWENWFKPLRKWIDPDTGETIWSETVQTNGLDFNEDMKWSTQKGEINQWATNRFLFYQAQLFYGRQFGQHDVTAMGVFNRYESSYNTEFKRFREDWAFRATYNYADRYFFEFNGAYNGSEKFGRDYRFDFFPSGAIGWRLSEEKFMNWSRNWLDNFKIRYSIGQVGDDSAGGRFLYQTQWAAGGSMSFFPNGASPYTWYKEAQQGNPDIHWEKALKQNLGIDFTIYNSLVNGTLEFFKEKRTDILVSGTDRAIPSYFGGSAPMANLGRVDSKGFELELRFNYTFANNLHLWANLNMTHSENKVIQKDDPALMESYRKSEGYMIGQDHIVYDAGYAQTWDDVIAMTPHNTNDDQKLPGQPIMVDYNGDGVIDSSDSTPYGYSAIPQNTYNATIGLDWKGWSLYVQMYGVTNAQRTVVFESYRGKMSTLYAGVNFWSPGAADADVDRPLPVWNATPSYYNGWDNRYNHYDGSYFRLKNVEIAYTWTSGWIKKVGLSNLKVYINGNNLLQWSHMPDDRESNFAAGGGNASLGAYPTVRRFNIGIKFDI